MAKVVCESCGTSFLYNVVKDMEICPVCGKPLWEDSAEETEKVDNFSQNKVLSFGDGVELGENDSFDEDKIDFWWYEIIEPGDVWESITFTDGDVSANCAKCGHFVGSVPYPVAKTKDYLLIDSRFKSKCGHCGNELKNHILSKRPADWADPRKRDMWVKDYENIPKCPICSSIKIHKISLTNKAASALAFGVLSVGHVSKTYKCDTCGAKF